MKRVMLTLAAATIVAGSFAGTAPAQNYPTQPIRLIISFGPGGGTDVVGRILAQRMQEKLGQPVVVENRPGAGGTIGNEMISKAPKDGYTIGIMTAGQIINPVMSKQPRYDTLAVFDSIGQVATAGLLIVAHNDAAFKNVKELVEYAKANPGKLNFGTPGYGATQHMSSELFKQVAGINTQQVQFRTSGEAMTALLAKQIDVLFETIPAVLGQVQGGQVRALALTGKDRFPALPDVPGAVESGVLPGYDVTTWYGFFGPRGLPKPVVAKLNATLKEILAEPTIRDRMTKSGVAVKTSTPEEFQAFMAAEFAKWTKVRIAAGLEQR